MSSVSTLKPVIKVGIEKDGFKPFVNVSSKSSHITGYEVDLLQFFASEKGYKLEFVPLENNPEMLFNALTLGTIDIVTDCLVITEERLKTYAFSTPTSFTPFAGTSNHNISTFDVLKEAHFIVVKNADAEKYVQTQFPTSPLTVVDTTSNLEEFLTEKSKDNPTKFVAVDEAIFCINLARTNDLFYLNPSIFPANNMDMGNAFAFAKTTPQPPFMIELNEFLNSDSGKKAMLILKSTYEIPE